MMKRLSALLFLCSLVITAAAQQDDTTIISGDTVNVGRLHIIHSDNNRVKIYDRKDTIPAAGNNGNYAQDDTVKIGRINVIHTEDYNGHTNVKIYGNPNRSRVKTHWFAIDFGLNNYNDQSSYNQLSGADPNKVVYDYSPEGLRTFAGPDATEHEFGLVTGKSVNVDIWIFRQERDIAGRVFGIEYGVGVMMNNFRYKQNISYINDNSTHVIRDSVAFIKNKLFTEYLSVPVMLCFNFPGHQGNDFHIKIGADAGYLIKSRTKQKSSQRGKQKNNDNFNLSKFRVSPEIDLGWRWWSLYANYSITPLHQDGVKQYPFAVGIRFGGF